MVLLARVVSNVALPVFYFFCFGVVDAMDHKDGKRAADTGSNKNKNRFGTRTFTTPM